MLSVVASTSCTPAMHDITQLWGFVHYWKREREFQPQDAIIPARIENCRERERCADVQTRGIGRRRNDSWRGQSNAGQSTVVAIQTMKSAKTLQAIQRDQQHHNVSRLLCVCNEYIAKNWPHSYLLWSQDYCGILTDIIIIIIIWIPKLLIICVTAHTTNHSSTKFVTWTKKTLLYECFTKTVISRGF